MYFLSNGPMSADTGFTSKSVEELHNTFMVNAYTNVFFRVTGKKLLMNLKNLAKRPENFSESQNSQIKHLEEIFEKTKSSYSNYNFAEVF